MLPVKRRIVRPTVTRLFNDDWNTLFDWSNANFSTSRTSTPSVNVKELKDGFLVEVAAPGLKKEDFKVELNKNVLTISADVQQESTDEEDSRYTRKEFSFQSFSRSFNLDKRVIDGENIIAGYESGILSLTLPKREEAKEKPARTIEIS